MFQRARRSFSASTKEARPTCASPISSRADLPIPVAPAAAATALASAQTQPVQMAALDPTVTAPVARVESDDADAPPEGDAPDPPPQSAPPDTQAETLAATPPPAAAHIWVQAGTFSVEDNAERLKERLSPLGDVPFLQSTETAAFSIGSASARSTMSAPPMRRWPGWMRWAAATQQSSPTNRPLHEGDFQGCARCAVFRFCLPQSD